MSCPRCYGQGQWYSKEGWFVRSHTCSLCKGTGRVVREADGTYRAILKY